MLWSAQLYLIFKMSFLVTKDTLQSDFCNCVEVKVTSVEVKLEICGFGREYVALRLEEVSFPIF